MNSNGGYLGVSRPTIYDLQFLFSGLTFSWVKQITIPGSSTLNLQIVVGKDKFIHFICRHIITYAPLISITVNENATFTIGTTTSPVFNSKYSSNILPTIEIYTDSTLTDAGTILEDIFLIPLLEWSQAEPEFILDQEMSYAIRITNGSLTAQVVDFNWVWYESDNTRITLGPAPNALNISAPNPRQIFNVAPKTYYAYSFNGINDYMTIPRSSSIEPMAQITVEFRMKLGVILSAQPYQSSNPLRKRDPTFPGGGGYEFYLNKDLGKLAFVIGINGVFNEVSINITSWDTNTIHHVAGIYDGNDIILYIDGVLTDNFATIGVIDVPTNINLFISSPNGINNFYEGMLDELRIWNIARTQPQIQSFMLGEIDPGTSGLTGYWKFNEMSGSIVYNGTSLANNGIIASATRMVISYQPNPAIITFTLPTPTVTNV